MTVTDLKCIYLINYTFFLLDPGKLFELIQLICRACLFINYEIQYIVFLCFFVNYEICQRVGTYIVSVVDLIKSQIGTRWH